MFTADALRVLIIILGGIIFLLGCKLLALIAELYQEWKEDQAAVAFLKKVEDNSPTNRRKGTK